MKKLLMLLLVCGLLLSCSACGHEHIWQAATCSSPATCIECGKMDPDAVLLTHVWQDATCTTAKTCTNCGKTEGTLAEHTPTNWENVTESTCTEEGKERGVCSVCDSEIERPLPLADHTPGEWVITKQPTASNDGEQTKSCIVCSEVLETKSFSLSAEEIEAQYKANCTTYSYDTIARDPDSYMFTYGAYTGEIIQVLEDGNDLQLRVDITQTTYGYTDTIFVLYTQKEGASRLLEDDIVKIYGMNMGTISYETIFGQTITLPCVYAEYIDLQ